MKINTEPQSPGWNLDQCLVFVSTFVCMVLPMGYFYSMGRTFVAVLDTFHSTRAQAAVIQSTTIGVFMASGIVTGGLIQRFGTKKCGLAGSLIFCGGHVTSYFSSSVTFLVISQGIVAGAGLSLIYICCYTVVGQTFAGHSSLVGLSCVAFASGLGGMIFPYILEHFITYYGLRGTYLIIGGINMNCFALSLLWPNKTLPAKPGGSQKSSLLTNLKQLISNKSFVLFTVGIAVINPALSIFLIFVADTILDNGFRDSDASLALLVLNITSTLGRPIPLLLKQLPNCSSLFIPLLASVIGIVGLLSMAYVQMLSVNLISCCLTGLSLGITVPCYSIISVRLVGAALLPTAFGFLFTVTAVGNISAPPLSGMIRDMTESYVSVYTMSAAAMLLGGVFFLLAQFVHVKTRTNQNSSTLPTLLNGDTNKSSLKDFAEA